MTSLLGSVVGKNFKLVAAVLTVKTKQNKYLNRERKFAIVIFKIVRLL